MIDWLGYALGVIAVILILLPPKYDRALWWKGRQDGWL
jgi:hypothetical protein